MVRRILQELAEAAPLALLTGAVIGLALMNLLTANATGIWAGVNVTLSGYRIGEVESVELASDGQVDVSLRIVSRYRRLVGPQSRATAVQEGLIGDTVVALTADITPAESELPPAELAVAFEPASGPAELLRDLADTRLQLDPTLQAIAAVVEKDLPSVAGQVDGTLMDVRRLAGTIERESGSTASVLVDTLGQIRAASATTNRLLKAPGGALLFDVSDPQEESAPVGAEPAVPEQPEPEN